MAMAGRRVLIAGNWKMNLTREPAARLVAALREGMAHWDGVDVAVFPPFTLLIPVHEQLGGSGIAMGAQDVYPEPEGAFTGEIAPSQLLDAGCRYVLVGHSERRHIIGEGPELLARKIRASVEAGLEVVYCVGERLEEREAGRTLEVLDGQLGTLAESGVGLERVTLAYEPVWAIGTGRVATPEQAQEAQAYIRGWLVERYNPGLAAGVRILYGGSVKPENAAALVRQPDVDGCLVGGASLKAESFLGIIAAARG